MVHNSRILCNNIGTIQLDTQGDIIQTCNVVKRETRSHYRHQTKHYLSNTTNTGSQCYPSIYNQAKNMFGNSPSSPSILQQSAFRQAGYHPVVTPLWPSTACASVSSITNPSITTTTSTRTNFCSTAVHSIPSSHQKSTMYQSNSISNNIPSAENNIHCLSTLNREVIATRLCQFRPIQQP